MKTTIIQINQTLSNMDEVFDEVKKYCAYQGLSQKDALTFQLLAEEMMGMTRNIANEFSAQFWAENSEQQNELHLEMKTNMNMQKFNELIDTSSSGKNAAAKGLIGKTRNIMERCFLNYDEVMQHVDYNPSVAAYGMAGIDSTCTTWSLKHCQKNILKNKDSSSEAQEAWDELEKSVVAKLADEIQVGIRGDHVQVVVFKTF